MSIVIGILGLILLYVGVPWIYGHLARRLRGRMAKEHEALVLTFDDGPGSSLTPAILDVLADGKARATFFLLGSNIAGRINEGLTLGCTAGGCRNIECIGTHSFSSNFKGKAGPGAGLKEQVNNSTSPERGNFFYGSGRNFLE